MPTLKKVKRCQKTDCPNYRRIPWLVYTCSVKHDFNNTGHCPNYISEPMVTLPQSVIDGLKAEANKWKKLYKDLAKLDNDAARDKNARYD